VKKTVFKMLGNVEDSPVVGTGTGTGARVTSSSAGGAPFRPIARIAGGAGGCSCHISWLLWSTHVWVHLTI